MKGCVFLTMKDSMYGFSLVGFQQVVTDKASLLETLRNIVSNSEPGIVFVDERLLTERIFGPLQLLEKQWGGAIISLPAPGKISRPADKDFGRLFIARVLGYQMKLS